MDYFSDNLGHMTSDRGVYMISFEYRMSKSVSDGREKPETVPRGGNIQAKS